MEDFQNGLTSGTRFVMILIPGLLQPIVVTGFAPMAKKQTSRQARKLPFTIDEIAGVLADVEQRTAAIRSLHKRMEKGGLDEIRVDGQTKANRACDLLDEWIDYAEAGYRKAARDAGLL